MNLADQLNLIADDVDTRLLPGAEEIRRTGDRARRRQRTRLTAGAVALTLVAAAAVALLSRNDTRIEPAPEPPRGPVVVENADGSLSVLPADGHALDTPLPDVGISHFALSPGGTKVVFDSTDPGGKRGVWTVASDGSDLERVKLGCGCLSGWGVDWSHDGTRLAYVTSAPNQPWTVRVRTLATGAEVSFTVRGVVEDVAFSPDDERLAFVVGDQDLHVATIDIDRGLTSLRAASPAHRNLQDPTWSADGKTIYYTGSDAAQSDADQPCCIETTELDRLRVNDVYAVDAETGTEQQITHATTGERYYTVDPHGRWLLTTRAVKGSDAWHAVIGWLSRDGKTFKPVTYADGQPLSGMTAELQP